MSSEDCGGGESFIYDVRVLQNLRTVFSEVFISSLAPLGNRNKIHLTARASGAAVAGAGFD